MEGEGGRLAVVLQGGAADELREAFDPIYPGADRGTCDGGGDVVATDLRHRYAQVLQGV